eukprot:3448645-Rhodomonas_salina.3
MDFNADPKQVFGDGTVHMIADPARPVKEDFDRIFIENDQRWGGCGNDAVESRGCAVYRRAARDAEERDDHRVDRVPGQPRRRPDMTERAKELENRTEQNRTEQNTETADKVQTQNRHRTDAEHRVRGCMNKDECNHQDLSDAIKTASIMTRVRGVLPSGGHAGPR